MRLLGLEIVRAKPRQDVAVVKQQDVLQNVNYAPGGGGWWPVIRESFTGAWQRNIAVTNTSVLSYSAVYSCVTLIASDIAKIGLDLVQQDPTTLIWSVKNSPSFSPVLRRPNRYQNRNKFIEQWVVSKLVHGNTYVLLERDARQVVVAMYVLNPMLTKPLVAPDGEVFYQLSPDILSGIEDTVVVPASEIIHDVMVPLYHPLCGVSPISACGTGAMQGLAIQTNSTRFFQNGSNPGGLLTSPDMVDKDTATRVKEYWDQNFSGQNSGRVAVLGNGLTYQALGVNAVDAQLIEQLKWSAEQVCSCFHVPAYMIGVGLQPTHNNIEALAQQYYSQCLQGLIKSIEECLDDGLGLLGVPGVTYGAKFDLDDLLRMDMATKVETYAKAIQGTLFAPDEARKKFDLKAVPGGKSPMAQHQMYSLEALAKRDAKDDPFASNTPAPTPTPAAGDTPPSESASSDPAATAQLAAWELRSVLGMAA